MYLHEELSKVDVQLDEIFNQITKIKKETDDSIEAIDQAFARMEETFKELHRWIKQRL